jgi:hypothetical protein
MKPLAGTGADFFQRRQEDVFIFVRCRVYGRDDFAIEDLYPYGV